MNLPWIIWVGPSCDHKCLYKGEAGDLTHTEEKAMSPQRRSLEVTNQHHQKLEEGREGFSPRAFGGNAALLTP